ncbi:MAG: hypothetical protein CM15mP58_22300 [Burkholderiaceae bacterium]|nr:MAG: hypothetical protein CM15mP58_22300 [Burkholderiaceae bacterium]
MLEQIDDFQVYQSVDIGKVNLSKREAFHMEAAIL